MRFRKFAAGLLLSISALVSFQSHASLATWQFQNIVMSDGANVAGSFTVDTTLQAFVDWSVSIAGGNETTFPAYTWDTSNSQAHFDGAFYSSTYGWRQVGGFISNEFFNVTTPGGNQVYIDRVLNFLSPSLFSQNTGVVNIQWLNDCFDCTPWRSMISAGQLVEVPSPVPAPPAFILMLTGLGVLGFTKRFRKGA